MIKYNDSYLGIVVVSAFRNTTPANVRRWYNQVMELLPHFLTVRAVAVEGDSHTPSTRSALYDVGNVEVVHHAHGGLPYGSVEHPDRMRQLSGVGNAMLDAVKPRDTELVLYVESDLLWTGGTIHELATTLVTTTADVMVPLVFAGDYFYDTWGFRGLDGERWSPFYPYHSDVLRSRERTVVVRTAGSCLLMWPHVVPLARMRTNALVEWGEQITDGGRVIMVDTKCRIDHPA